ncbi:MAG: hypothetical protein JXQ87_13725 [Bacteroidia bacterium]
MTAALIKFLTKFSPILASIQSAVDTLKGDDVLQKDGGPTYWETNMDNLFPEPFNMVSAAIFMLIALYWFVKANRQVTSFRFLKLSSIILAVGGLGGTIYHGFRIWEWAMWMDWFPILILCIAAAAYFIYSIYKSIFWALAALFIAVVLQVVNFYTIPFEINTSTSYGILAAFIIVPLIMALVKTKFLYWYYPLIAFAAFGLALYHRVIDSHPPAFYGSVGTHFLWHLFGAVACHAMFRYLFLFKRAFPRFALINKMRLRNIRIANVKKAREKILKRWKANRKGAS